MYLKEDSDCTTFQELITVVQNSICMGLTKPMKKAANTSSQGLDQRIGSDCDSDTDCVLLQFTGSYHFAESQWKDGEWTMTIRNEMVNDLDIESLTISLLYK